MPEGPEIRLAADKVAAVLENQQIESVEFGLPALRRYDDALQGATVTRIETRGKAMLTHFDNDMTIYSHNQLYGLWKTARRGALPNTNRSLRLALHTATHSALLYSASDISVWQTDDLHEHPFLARIGPDILDESVSWQAIAERLQEKRFAGRSLAALYLDQKFLAGVGNYLRAEILFFAGLNPLAKPALLTRGQRGELARASLSVSQRSYATKGLTNKSALVRSLRAKGLSRAQLRFAVFGRDGLDCYDCGTKIVRETVGSRRLYFCPVCQSTPSV